MDRKFDGKEDKHPEGPDAEPEAPVIPGFTGEASREVLRALQEADSELVNARSNDGRKKGMAAVLRYCARWLDWYTTTKGYRVVELKTSTNVSAADLHRMLTDDEGGLCVTNSSTSENGLQPGLGKPFINNLFDGDGDNGEDGKAPSPSKRKNVTRLQGDNVQIFAAQTYHHGQLKIIGLVILHEFDPGYYFLDEAVHSSQDGKGIMFLRPDTEEDGARTKLPVQTESWMDLSVVCVHRDYHGYGISKALVAAALIAMSKYKMKPSGRQVEGVLSNISFLPGEMTYASSKPLLEKKFGFRVTPAVAPAKEDAKQAGAKNKAKTKKAKAPRAPRAATRKADAIRAAIDFEQEAENGWDGSEIADLLRTSTPVILHGDVKTAETKGAQKPSLFLSLHRTKEMPTVQENEEVGVLKVLFIDRATMFRNFGRPLGLHMGRTSDPFLLDECKDGNEKVCRSRKQQWKFYLDTDQIKQQASAEQANKGREANAPANKGQEAQAPAKKKKKRRNGGGSTTGRGQTRHSPRSHRGGHAAAPARPPAGATRTAGGRRRPSPCRSASPRPARRLHTQ